LYNPCHCALAGAINYFDLLIILITQPAQSGPLALAAQSIRGGAAPTQLEEGPLPKIIRARTGAFTGAFTGTIPGRPSAP
jgi:hypothetical protein